MSNDETIKQEQGRAEEAYSDEARAERAYSDGAGAERACGAHEAHGTNDAHGEKDCRGENAQSDQNDRSGEGENDAEGASEGTGSENNAKGASEAQGANEGEDTKDAGNDKGASDKAQEEEALNMKYMRLMADFQNFKRRTEKEKSDIYAFANEKIVSELLNVIDNFERALDAATEGDGFAEGMKLIFKQLQGVLEKAGVVEIEALGTDFDPNFHNAVMMEDSTEYESGKVTEVLQKGYLLNNRVIRPSMVKVAN